MNDGVQLSVSQFSFIELSLIAQNLQRRNAFWVEEAVYKQPSVLCVRVMDRLIRDVMTALSLWNIN